MLDLKDWYAYGTGYKSTVQKTVFNSLLVGNELISTINCVLLIGSKKKKILARFRMQPSEALYRDLYSIYITIPNHYTIINSLLIMYTHTHTHRENK